MTTSKRNSLAEDAKDGAKQPPRTELEGVKSTGMYLERR